MHLLVSLSHLIWGTQICGCTQFTPQLAPDRATEGPALLTPGQPRPNLGTSPLVPFCLPKPAAPRGGATSTNGNGPLPALALFTQKPGPTGSSGGGLSPGVTSSSSGGDVARHVPLGSPSSCLSEPSRARWPPHCPSHTPRAGGRQLPSPGAGGRGGLCALLSPHTLPPAAVSLPDPGMADHVLTASAPATGRSRVVWGSAASPWASYILPKCPMTWLVTVFSLVAFPEAQRS